MRILKFRKTRGWKSLQFTYLFDSSQLKFASEKIPLKSISLMMVKNFISFNFSKQMCVYRMMKVATSWQYEYQKERWMNGRPPNLKLCCRYVVWGYIRVHRHMDASFLLIWDPLRLDVRYIEKKMNIKWRLKLQSLNERRFKPHINFYAT